MATVLYWYAVIVTVTFFFFLFKVYQFTIPHWFRQRFAQKFAKRTEKWVALSELEFVHSVSATKYHTDLVADGVVQKAGGNLTVVLHHQGKIIGNIGLDCTPYGMHVVQMQGVKGVYLSKLGIKDADRFFLECAEAIARTLGYRRVLILEASSHQYFEKDPAWGSLKKREAHKERMIRRYNLVPKQMGYRGSLISPWSSKKLEQRKLNVK